MRLCSINLCTVLDKLLLKTVIRYQLQPSLRTDNFLFPLALSEIRVFLSPTHKLCNFLTFYLFPGVFALSFKTGTRSSDDQKTSCRFACVFFLPNLFDSERREPKLEMQEPSLSAILSCPLRLPREGRWGGGFDLKQKRKKMWREKAKSGMLGWNKRWWMRNRVEDGGRRNLARNEGTGKEQGGRKPLCIHNLCKYIYMYVCMYFGKRRHVA